MTVYQVITPGSWLLELELGDDVITEESTSLESAKTFALLVGSLVVALPSCRILVTPFSPATGPGVRLLGINTGCIAMWKATQGT